MNCKYCNIEYKLKRALIQHEIRCYSNPSKINTNRSEETKQKIRNTFKEKNINNQVIWNSEMKLKASERSKVTNLEYWNDITRKKQSDIMRKVVRDNPESYSSNNVSGRVKTITYNGFKLKGNWELLVAKWLDDNNYTWTNIFEPYEYNWNNSIHLYFPDFYVYELNLYIEVKGYQRERDLAKWKSLSNLIIIKKSEITHIKNNTYNINRVKV